MFSELTPFSVVVGYKRFEGPEALDLNLHRRENLEFRIGNNEIFM
jgi:hypothetical protein